MVKCSQLLLHQSLQAWEFLEICTMWKADLIHQIGNDKVMSKCVHEGYHLRWEVKIADIAISIADMQL